MKRIALLLIVASMALACSSDDNKSGGNSEGATEVGVSYSHKIKIPSWLQGQWVTKGSSEYDIHSFNLKANDLCVVTVVSNCYQSQINAIDRIDPNQVVVEQENKNKFYRLSIDIGGLLTEYAFTYKSENEVLLKMSNLPSVTLIRK
ncbi:hypothetical protein Q2490_13510 [Myroides odoratimimus]|uniref:hypothetical protein n=1 Tax=Myroides odoratimimus TaxID=76832 RepID=UPI0026DEE613|nr:hypothetical protein [Myroides odoratimimus]MDO5858307.1 hypothetical protein [Myroides odoratimimus]